MNRPWQYLAAAAVAAVPLSFSAAVPVAARTAGPAQARVFTGSDLLWSVSATGPGNAWAVGDYFVGTAIVHSKPLIEHWNGTKWRLVASPKITGTSSSYLLSVAALSAKNAWAVGARGGKALIEHWNGFAWHLVNGAAIRGKNVRTEFGGVAAVSAKSVWAVGSVYTSRGLRPLIEHWNGAKWRVVASPDPGGLAASDYLRAVAASRAGVWAVGTSAPGNIYQTLVLALVHGTWRRVRSADPSGLGNWLGSVSAAGGRVLAAGYGGYDNPAAAHALILHRTPIAFRPDATPNLGATAQDELFGVAATSAGGWAVGRSSAQTLILREQSGQWSQVPSPSWPSPATSLLEGVTTWRGAAWAVGQHCMAIGPISVCYSLILRWKNGSWVQVPSPNR